MMYQLHLNFKNKTKKLTISKHLSSEDLVNLISNTFKLKQKIIGLTNRIGNFIDIKNLQRTIASNNPKQIYYLITAEDFNQENMSFASQYHEKNNNYAFDTKQKNFQRVKLPDQHQNYYLGLIGDLQHFQDLILQDNKVGLIICFIKYKPKGVQFPYYLHHTNKNSAIIFVNKSKVCQFFIEDMKNLPRQIFNFLQSLAQHKQPVKSGKNSRQRNQEQILQDNDIIDDKDIENDMENNNNDGTNLDNDNEVQVESQSKNQSDKQKQMRQSLMQNLIKLKEQQEISEFQFYKMKSQLLQNIHQFIRKYQMGTRKGFRREPFVQYRKSQSQRSLQKLNKVVNKTKQKQTQKHKQRMYSRDERRFKKYQIPIIVRKYNNVVQKISTSYPLTQEQEQSINLIFELQLKGLISQKESGIYKASILQEDPEVFELFIQYFNGTLDQVELVAKLKRIKKVGSQKRERAQHNMRLLMKYSKQSNYELLRNLLMEGNLHIINSLQKFRIQKNYQLLTEQLEKIANFYKQKEMLEKMFDNR